MNKPARRMLALFFLATTSLNAHATERYHVSTVKFVYPLGTGEFIIGFDVDTAQCSSDQTPKYMYVAAGQNGVTAEGAPKIYAAVLTAFAMGKRLYIAFDDSTPACYINR